MAGTVSDFLVQRLIDWGVKRIFGYPGDGINGVMGALGRHVDELTFIQVRHEETAAFMACAHAKFTGEVGVCLATSGPGAIHLLNGLYDARMDHQPVVAIVGQSARFALGSSFQQEVDLANLFKDVAREYVVQASHPAQVRTMVDRAFRIAAAERTVTCLILPNDLQEEPMQAMPRKHGACYTGVGYREPIVIPRDQDLQAAARVLNEGKRVAMLIGAGTLGAPGAVVAVADRLQAGVAKALLGKAALPDDIPWVTGSIGLLGTKPSWDLMQRCDTLLMVGTSFPYSEFLPPEGQARGVQIDRDGRRLSLRYPMEVALQGDAAETLQRLLPLLDQKPADGWRAEIEAGVRDWWKVLEARAMAPANPLNPQRVFWELSPRLPDGVILTADSGTSASWFARDLKIRPGMLASLSGNLATMGPGVPYALAAKFAFAHRPVIAMVGDGAMQMNGMAELITAAKYWQTWSDPRLIVLVLVNRDLNMVTWEQRVMNGDPKFAPSQDLPEVSYARFAQGLGLRGIRVDHPDDVGAAWDEALASDRPIVLEAITDPDVPPLPPHISLDQARGYASAIFKGDPNAAGIIRMSFLQLVDGMIPRGERKER